MPRAFICPFCGQDGQKTREHVWAQWLRAYDGPQALLSESHGERHPFESRFLLAGYDGRHRSHTSSSGHVAELLPNVTVDVCHACNTGWMSNLERTVKAMLARFLEQDSAVVLKSDDLQALTAWATKSWMAYALLRPRQHNPFSESEYRAMAEAQTPIPRSLVWLMHSTDATAYVGIAVHPIPMTSGEQVKLDAPANSGFCFLAANTVVIFMAIPPPGVPQDAADFIFTPPTGQLDSVRRIWPDLRPQYFPIDSLPDGAVDALVEFPAEFADLVGLPTEGLTNEEAESVARDWFEGDDDGRTIRERWQR